MIPTQEQTPIYDETVADLGDPHQWVRPRWNQRIAEYAMEIARGEGKRIRNVVPLQRDRG